MSEQQEGLTVDPTHLSQLIAAEMGFEPTEEQSLLIDTLARFAISRLLRDAMVVNGYAGTGKTSVIGAFIRVLTALNNEPIPLAPTGRAAKVLASLSRCKAQTIHKRLYRGSELGGNDSFFLAENRSYHKLFIVDEASMITDSPAESGRSVLADLVRHVYSSPGCALLFVGDTAQLPPVGQPDSPAMRLERLEQLGLRPLLFKMETTMRHAQQSGILFNATRIRQAVAAAVKAPIPLCATGFADIEAISSAELADKLSSSWSKVGQEETLVVTRANWRANGYNTAIRQQVLFAEEPLQREEKLIVAKNNYYWTRINGLDDFLANGETVCLEWVGTPEKKHGRWFVDVELSRSGDERMLGAKILLRSLVSQGPSVPREETESLARRVMAETPGELTVKLKALDNDPYFNALQVKYAYCVTCHKAQGGQWKHVYIDMAGVAEEDMGTDFYRWLYTAFTRATEKVFLINPTLEIS